MELTAPMLAPAFAARRRKLIGSVSKPPPASPHPPAVM